MRNRMTWKVLCIGLTVVAAAILVGRQASQMVQAETSGPSSRAVEPASDFIEVAPADRKFFNGGYLYGWDGVRTEPESAEIHPDDVKLSNVPPCEQRDLGGLYKSLRPADCRFLHMEGVR
jgi:hypothetical protein